MNSGVAIRPAVHACPSLWGDGAGRQTLCREELGPVEILAHGTDPLATPLKVKYNSRTNSSPDNYTLKLTLNNVRLEKFLKFAAASCVW